MSNMQTIVTKVAEIVKEETEEGQIMEKLASRV